MPRTRHQFGGSFGGPLRRDRLFFFGGAERLQEDLGITNITTVPTDAVRSGAFGAINPVVRPYLDLYPRPNGRELSATMAEDSYEFNQPTRENFFQGRVDLSSSGNDSIFVRYTYDGADQSIPLGFAEYGTDSISRNQFLTGEYRRILTPALLNTVRFSHGRLRFEQMPVGPSLPNLAFVAEQDLIGVLTVPGFTNLGGGATNPSTNNSFYWTFSEDVSYSRSRHLLKAGALIEHLRTNKLTDRPGACDDEPGGGQGHRPRLPRVRGRPPVAAGSLQPVQPGDFAVPDRVVFAAARPDEAPLPTAGRITRTITSARQFQLGVKVLF